ncbi:MAG: hypothetical protein AAF962_11960 [Actinomycetota bacterium]
MGFIGNLARWGLAIFIVAGFVLALSFAIASAFIIPRQDVRDTSVAAELVADARTTGTVAAELVPEAEPIDPSTTVSQTAPPLAAAPRAVDGIPPQLDTSIASLSCSRPGDPASQAEPYVLTISEPADDPEPLVVAVDLALSDGRVERRTVEAAGGIPTEVTVPQSGGAAYVGCSIVAVQQGDQVVRFSG